MYKVEIERKEKDVTIINQMGPKTTNTKKVGKTDEVVVMVVLWW